MEKAGTLEWLLEPDQPAIRYLALTLLLGRPEGDPEVETARAAMNTAATGPGTAQAAEIPTAEEAPGRR